MFARRVLSIGQCYADHGSISRLLRQHFDAEVVPADGIDEALSRLRQGAFDLVLVNRVLDRDGGAGVYLVRRLKEDEALRAVPVMLVSNHADAQREAVEAGAEPGFGKAALGSPVTLNRLRAHLGRGEGEPGA
jgi:CheY-like chemotaxis protein